MNEFCLVFGLRKYTGSFSYYYPEAFVASMVNQRPHRMEKVATEEVLQSYQLDNQDAIPTRLLDLANELHPNSLEEKLQKNKKKKVSLSALFEGDPALLRTISKITEQGLYTFIQLIKKSSYNLYFEVERKKDLKDIQITFSEFELTPSVKFEKTAAGTNYFLYLNVLGNTIIPSQHNMEIILSKPTLVLQNFQCFQVNDIDGKKLIPFLKRDKVFIPSRITKQYFTTFIKDLVGQVDVEAEGFELHVISPEPKGVLKFSHGFYNDGFELMPCFYYDTVRFLYSERTSFRVNVDIEDSDTIAVKKVIRNVEKENVLLQSLFDMGMEATPAFRLVLKEADDEYDLLRKVIENFPKLQELGWQVEYPTINDHPLNISTFTITETVQGKNDWFDIEAIILVGGQVIKFRSLLESIHNGERIYKLPDGSCFIIPKEWMSRYAALAKFCDYKDDHVTLKKSHFTILEDMKLLQSDTAVKWVVKEQDVQFTKPVQVHAELRPYQIDGVKWLIQHYKNGLGACLADDMGLGKTLQTLTLLQFVKNELAQQPSSKEAIKPVGQLSLFETYMEARQPLISLIVCPATLVTNWEREVKKFTPSLMCTVHLGEHRDDRASRLEQFDIIITSYQTLSRDIGLFMKINFMYVIIDESHYIKNRDSIIFKNLAKLTAKNKLSLSGTPLENTLADLWSQMEFINPEILGKYPYFKKHYQDPIEKHKDAEALNELKMLLAPFILRRSKKDVLNELQDVEEQLIVCDMMEEQHKLAESEKSKARNLLLSNDGDKNVKFHVFAAILKLRQLANHPVLALPDYKGGSGKYEEIVLTIETLMAAGNKLLIFSSFLSHLGIIENFLKKSPFYYTRLTGEETAKEKKKAELRFQEEDDCRILLMTIKAGGVGLNLTAANYVLILDPWWNPYPEEQAIGRAHRLGQSQKVTVIRFISRDSIEEKIMKLQERKIDLVNSFMDFDSMPTLNDEMIMELLG